MHKKIIILRPTDSRIAPTIWLPNEPPAGWLYIYLLAWVVLFKNYCKRPLEIYKFEFRLWVRPLIAIRAEPLHFLVGTSVYNIIMQRSPLDISGGPYILYVQLLQTSGLLLGPRSYGSYLYIYIIRVIRWVVNYIIQLMQQRALHCKRIYYYSRMRR